MIIEYAMRLMVEYNPARTLIELRYDVHELERAYEAPASKTEAMILEDHQAPDFSIRNALVEEFGVEDLDESRLNACVDKFAEVYYSLPVSGNYLKGF